MNIAHPGSAMVGPRAQRAGGQLGTASVQEQHQAGAPSLLFLYPTPYVRSSPSLGKVSRSPLSSGSRRNQDMPQHRPVAPCFHRVQTSARWSTAGPCCCRQRFLTRRLLGPIWAVPCLGPFTHPPHRAELNLGIPETGGKTQPLQPSFRRAPVLPWVWHRVRLKLAT